MATEELGVAGLNFFFFFLVGSVENEAFHLRGLGEPGNALCLPHA